MRDDTDTIAIRQGTLDDYDAVSALIAETFAFHQRHVPEFFRETDSPPPTRGEMEKLLGDDRQGAWFLAEVAGEAGEAGEVVGFVEVEMQPMPTEAFLTPEVRAIVHGLGVRGAWQRRGVGRRLMDTAQDWARARGATRILLNVWSFNDDAQRLYERMGYTTFSQRMWKPL